MSSAEYCIIGAGFSGAVVARALAEAGHRVLVIDERDHVAGNCYSERDPQTGVMTHKYGPHIFHTDNEQVWAYLTRFADMVPYRHHVIAQSGGHIYALPVNLLTINQFFAKNFSPAEARAHLETIRRRDLVEPANFEEQALGMMGEALYRAFFEGYTRKQWGLDPRELPASILKRLPMRFDYDSRYFSNKYQAMPRDGYTGIVEKILAHPLIETQLGRSFETLERSFAHLIYSGPIDRYFGFVDGRLGYRTLDFEKFYGEGDVQGAAVINYCDQATPFTRITEHKHFAPWERDQFAGSILYREYSRACEASDIPYYPIRLAQEQAMLRRYVERTQATPGVTFIGRLGAYRYMDMDGCIADALAAGAALTEAIAAGLPPPAFVKDPL